MLTAQDIVFRQATNDDGDRVIKLVSDVLLEFQLPFDLSSKDADLKDIEIAYILPGGMWKSLKTNTAGCSGLMGFFR